MLPMETIDTVKDCGLEEFDNEETYKQLKIPSAKGVLELNATEITIG